MGAANLPPAAAADQDVTDTEIHARASAIVEAALDSVPARLTLLYAAAMLKATLAHGQPDPIAALEEFLADHSAATMSLLRDALGLDGETPSTERKS
ncbi:hypothetical protein LO749_06395 [Paracoccus denitrificans]|uniref:hypothetical protein n=1 Tax=Paracoccus denitrificans TaxID=266 RepID=UPI001E5F7037|nr:hypothetical protein [Paracoccus denitrificans]UFS63816.1 hypothetical protein LO749_06395 [Paracoccus denitrificans]